MENERVRENEEVKSEMEKNEGGVVKVQGNVSTSQVTTLPGHNYNLQVKTSKEMMGLCEFIYNQGLAPSSFKNPQSVFLGLQVAMSFGFNEYGQAYKALGQMFVIGNSVKLYGDLPLGIVEKKSNLLKDITEYFLDKEGNKICLENKNLNSIPYCAVCEIIKVDREKKSFFLTKGDLENSGGVFNEKTGQWAFKTKVGVKTPWRDFPKKMWKYRVRREALLSCFPEVFYGHEVGGFQPDEKFVGQSSAPDENEDFKKDFIEGGENNE